MGRAKVCRPALPAREVRRAKTLAKNRRTSTKRALVGLIESRLGSKEAERERFLELADNFGSVSVERESGWRGGFVGLGRLSRCAE